jgi:hypothetical protein
MKLKITYQIRFLADPMNFENSFSRQVPRTNQFSSIRPFLDMIPLKVGRLHLPQSFYAWPGLHRPIEKPAVMQTMA